MYRPTGRTTAKT